MSHQGYQDYLASSGPLLPPTADGQGGEGQHQPPPEAAMMSPQEAFQFENQLHPQQQAQNFGFGNQPHFQQQFQQHQGYQGMPAEPNGYPVPQQQFPPQYHHQMHQMHPMMPPPPPHMTTPEQMQYQRRMTEMQQVEQNRIREHQEMMQRQQQMKMQREGQREFQQHQQQQQQQSMWNGNSGFNMPPFNQPGPSNAVSNTPAPASNCAPKQDLSKKLINIKQECIDEEEEESKCRRCMELTEELMQQRRNHEGEVIHLQGKLSEANTAQKRSQRVIARQEQIIAELRSQLDPTSSKSPPNPPNSASTSSPNSASTSSPICFDIDDEAPGELRDMAPYANSGQLPPGGFANMEEAKAFEDIRYPKDKKWDKFSSVKKFFFDFAKKELPQKVPGVSKPHYIYGSNRPMGGPKWIQLDGSGKLIWEQYHKEMENRQEDMIRVGLIERIVKEDAPKVGRSRGPRVRDVPLQSPPIPQYLSYGNPQMYPMPYFNPYSHQPQ